MQVKLKWNYVGSPSCHHFNIYKSNADGSGPDTSLSQILGSTTNAVPPTDANPFVINLNAGQHKIWCAPANSSSFPIAAAVPLEFTLAEPPVTDFQLVP